MYQIQNLTTDPKQKQTLVLPDGTQVTMTIEYVPSQLGWFLRTLTYGDFVLNNIRICNNPNLLYQWRNLVPFGLACSSLDTQREPSLQEDFASGASALFILSEADVELYTRYLSGG